MSETLQPALPERLDSKAEELMDRLCDREMKVATAYTYHYCGREGDRG